MRILILTQYLAKGGLERIVGDLALQFQQRGCHVWVAVYESDGLDTTLCETLRRNGIVTLVWKKRSGFCWRTVWQLFRTCRNQRIDIIHAHDLGALIYAVCARFLRPKNTKIVHTQHSFVHLKKQLKRYAFYERIFSSFASHICTVSEKVFRTYTELGVPVKKISIVPNGIAFPENESLVPVATAPHFRPAQEKSSWRSEVCRADKRRLLSLGRIVRGKGLEHLLQAWTQMPALVHNKWQLVCVGPWDATFFHEVLTPLLEAGNGDVVFTGPTDSPFHFYLTSDAFVSLSEEEGMPLAAHEAIGSGLPALLSDIDGHRSLSRMATLVALDGPPATLASTLASWLLATARRTGTRLEYWQQRENFRSRHSSAAMAEHYLRIFAHHIRSALVLMAALAMLVPCITIAQSDSPQITDLIEKPEYLDAQDWIRNIDLRLSTEESTLLTFRNPGLCGSLPHLQGETLTAAVSLHWFRGVALSVSKPSYEGARLGPHTDALVPVTSPLPCSDGPAQPVTWYFAEVKMRASDGPLVLSGRLEGAMMTSSDRVSTLLSWPLQIQRLPFRFEGRWSLPLRAEFIPYYSALAHDGQSSLHEGKLTEQYVRAMVEHRLLPLKTWIKQPFQNEQERESSTFSLSRFPHPDLAISKTVFPSLPAWAESDVPRIDSDSDETRSAYWKRWRRYLSEEKQESLEQSVQKRFQNNPFVYLWDEPKQSEWPLLIRFARSVREHAPEFRVLITTYPWSSLLNLVQIFVPLLDTLSTEGRPELPEGTELWSYVSCMSHGCNSSTSSGEPDFVVERNASYIRVWSWMAHHFNLSGVLYYAVNNMWRKSKTVDVWSDIFDFTGNGDGTLFYPGKPGQYGLSEHTPVPSLRLKIWRQTSFDAEYIKLAEEHNPLCFRKVNAAFALIQSARLWKRDSRQFQMAREKLIDCLVPQATDSAVRRSNP
ncbi:MAG: hypothetical protein RIR26_1810 [Pseudomonadota bacterium]|jgi:glycosyltransferase involved in cell wall biosynthesis